jgi:hypothetical protein
MTNDAETRRGKGNKQLREEGGILVSEIYAVK